MKSQILFWTIQIVLVVAVIVAGMEFIASFYTPPWSYIMLRPYMLESGYGIASAGTDKSKYVEPYYNSWGMRDHERAIDRPTKVKFRSVFVGDSFLEGTWVKAPLSIFVENSWTASGYVGMEAINLGVSATDPPQYYYRIKRVALRLKPDVVLVMFYSGNDFLSEPFGSHLISPFVSELPEPSVLGSVAPNLTWIVVDRLRLSQTASVSKAIPHEIETLDVIVGKPRAERIDALTRHMKQYYFPQRSDETIREILSRPDEEFWSAIKSDPNKGGRLQGWMLRNVIGPEINSSAMPKNEAEADRMLDMPKVEATLSWLVAMRRLVESHETKFIVALAPVGVVDPAYVNYWRFWPAAFGYWFGADARHRKLTSLLRQQHFSIIDLRTDLGGVPGTYHLLDGHWNERGHRIVAARLAHELLELSQH